jgi:hypothetical protein
LNKDQKREFLASYKNLTGEFEELWISLPEIFWQFKPSRRSWTALEVISHLADTEGIYYIRFRKAIAEKNSDSLGFDQENWAVNLSYNKNDPKIILESFKAMRTATYEVLNRLNEKVWENTYKHPHYGKLSLVELLGKSIEHVSNHKRKLEEKYVEWLKNKT